MSSRQADQQASNAIVTQTAFYAAALQRAHGEAEQHEQTIAVLRVDKQARDKELQAARVENDNLRSVITSLETKLANSEKALQSSRNIEDTQRQELAQLRRDLDAEKRRTRELQTEFNEYKRVSSAEAERLNRVNIESHNERDKNVQSLRQTSEAFGKFKGEVIEALKPAGFPIENAADILNAIRAMMTVYMRTNVVAAVIEEPKALPPKGKPPKSF